MLDEDLMTLSNLPVSVVTGKPVIHFAHANGMPSRVYTTLFAQLETWFTIEYIAVLGFDSSRTYDASNDVASVDYLNDGLGKPKYPVDNHWKNLTQQVVNSVKVAKRKHQIPIIGLGHSLGALCTLQAIYKEPNLFVQAVLMDPPLIYGRRSLLWHLAKVFSPKMVDKMSPSGISKHRRDVWDSRQQARELFKDKSFFKNFDERTFDAYIDYGLREREDGKVTLTISKDMEVAVFRTNPSWYWLTPNQAPLKPVTLLIGEDSLFYKYKFPLKIHKRLSIPFKLHKGGHMFPLEYPDSVVTLIVKTISKQACLE